MLQEGEFGLDRVLDALHLVANLVTGCGQHRHDCLAQRRNNDVAIRAGPVGEAVENEPILETELPRLVRDPENDDNRRRKILQDKRVHEAGVGIVVVWRDRHSPAIAAGDLVVFENALQRRPILRGDTLHDRFDLPLEMGVSDCVGQSAPFAGGRGLVAWRRVGSRGHSGVVCHAIIARLPPRDGGSDSAGTVGERS